MDETGNAGVQGETPRKKTRNFIAGQACDPCRRKKTRCDEDVPCGLCKLQGIECHYSERKTTKHEASYSSILQTLCRVERKIDCIQAERVLKQDEPGPRATQSSAECFEYPRSLTAIENPSIDALDHPSIALSHTGLPVPLPVTASIEQSTPLSFSAHLTLAWPGIRKLLPESVNAACKDFGFHYVRNMEFSRTPLPVTDDLNATDWISQLRLNVFKDLSYSYFRNFNTVFPIIDPEVYFQQTLPSAMNCDFGVQMDACTVLLVMALGSWGKDEPSRPGDCAPTHTPPSHHSAPDHRGETENIAGLAYFNEARRRMTFFDTDVGLQSCQIYLLAGLYYAQATRPGQWWMMTNRASLCSSLYWREAKARSARGAPDAQLDSWEKDMQSRIFWTCVMFETLLADEMDMPNTSLLDHCEFVPLPKFISPTFLGTASTPNRSTTNDPIFHYHFLSQIAHRIFLTRVRDSMFHSSPRNGYPTRTLEDELYHQLEQWKNQLPPDLAFDLHDALPTSGSSHSISAAAWIRARYIISKYHIRRPLMHRAFMNPESLSDEDVEKCGETLSSVIAWTAIMEHVLTAGSCVPYHYFIYSQLFGQIVVVYGLSASPDPRLQLLIHREHCQWYKRALNLIAMGVRQSSTIAKDYEIATLLCPQSAVAIVS